MSDDAKNKLIETQARRASLKHAQKASGEVLKLAERERRSAESENRTNRRISVKKAKELSNESLKQAKREARALESENKKNRRESIRKAKNMSAGVLKEAQREARAVESENAFNRRQAIAEAKKLSDEAKKDAVREVRSVESQNKYNQRKSRDAAIKASDEEQQRRIREQKSSESEENLVRRKAKQAANSAQAQELVSRVLADGTLILGLKVKPEGSLVISQAGTKIAETKSDTKVVIDCKSLKPDEPLTFSACGKDLKISILKLLTLVGGHKEKLGFKKSLTFTSVVCKFPPKKSPLVDIVKSANIEKKGD